MQALLITARVVHFAAAISLTGVFAFECLVATPALRAAGADHAAAAGLRRRFRWLAWASLALALISGTAWLLAVAADMSGKPLGLLWSQGTVGIVLTDTQFGQDWLVRLGGAVLLGALLVARQERRPRVDAAARWASLTLAALLLASLAWAGHGAATAGAAGDLHLAGDLLHLLATGTWLGTLPPLALLLNEVRCGGLPWPAVARAATRRYSTIAIISVVALLAGGLLNTWFLAGTVPALVGTQYGRLLLAKIALFVAMLIVASVNLLRLTPRLANATTSRIASQLRRNTLIETALGFGVLTIVGLLGILPPGLHTEPGWPFPFRLNFAALPVGSMVAVAISAALILACAIAAVAAAAAGRYRTTAGLVVALLLCAVAGWVPLRAAVDRAYPTSFYAPAQPYDAESIVRGASIYADNCAACHGTAGKGNGPAAAGLPIRPANLTEPHLFVHSPGDLFWWVSHGRANGAMPGFEAVLKPSQRWDVINFVLGRAAGELSREVGPEVTAAAAYPVPDFAFESAGVQDTLGQELQKGPALLVLFAEAAPHARLQQLVAAQPRLADAGLHVIAVSLTGPKKALEGGAPTPVMVDVSADVIKALEIFQTAADAGETYLMLDRGGNVRARWTAAEAGGLPDTATLVADAARAARFAVAAPSHAGHAH